jgi:hypothetical protein
VKTRSVRAKLLHADRQTERRAGMTKPTVTFRNFAKAKKKLFFVKFIFGGKPLTSQAPPPQKKKTD